MQRFSKLATCSTRELRTRLSRHGIHTSSGEPSITLLEHNEALKQVRGVWLGRCQKQRAVLAKVKKQCEEKAILLKQETALIKNCEKQKAMLFRQCGQKATLLEQCVEQKAKLFRECEQKDMLIKEREEEKATLLKQCEQKATLLKQCEEQKATLLKQCEQKDTLLQWCKEQMTMSFEQSERQKAAFLKEFEQEKSELPKLRPYEEWRNKPSEYSERMDKWMEKLNERQQRRWDIIDQKAEVLKEKGARQKLEQTLRMRGLLRFIVDRAREHNKIWVSPEETIQEALDKLAQTREFTTILQQEVKARGLNPTLVMEYFHCIDYELSKPLIWQGPPVTVREGDFSDYDRAVLVILLKVQSSWPYPLVDWKEETSRKEGK